MSTIDMLLETLTKLSKVSLLGRREENKAPTGLNHFSTNPSGWLMWDYPLNAFYYHWLLKSCFIQWLNRVKLGWKIEQRECRQSQKDAM